ncbi:MAG: LysR family transcriptional regulator [Paracoccus denitrificans]|nr:MAG: LysR family transcriptional regulator [Paracoccus denitrificans]PZO83285.1 MAG: LysR family transcriptional regulator [Paracoccus denitrificans]
MRRIANRTRDDENAPSHRAGRIPLVALKQAVAVAEYLNFRHAANRLGVSQSSVSTRIKALEDDLGILLFERRHRGVRLTEAGRIFVAEIAAGIEHLDHAIMTAGAISSGTVGRLNIGLHSSITAKFLADLRRKYREKYPDIELVITEGRSADTIRQVREGALDIAFVMGAADAPDCHSRLVWSEPFVIALPTHNPSATAESLSWLDLASETFFVRQGGAGPQMLSHITRRIAERDRTPSIRRCDVGRDTLMHMVADGEGITLTTEAATHVPFPGVAFRMIADETEQARFSAVWSPHNRSQALKNLLDLAAEMSRSA